MLASDTKFHWNPSNTFEDDTHGGKYRREFYTVVTLHALPFCNVGNNV